MQRIKIFSFQIPWEGIVLYHFFALLYFFFFSKIYLLKRTGSHDGLGNERDFLAFAPCFFPFTSMIYINCFLFFLRNLIYTSNIHMYIFIYIYVYHMFFLKKNLKSILYAVLHCISSISIVLTVQDNDYFIKNKTKVLNPMRRNKRAGR